MRTLIITSFIVLGYGISAIAEETTGDAIAGAKKAESCMQCHHSPISLQERGVEEIARQIKTIRAGDKGHPPGLNELRDEDILDISAYLNGD